MAQLRGGSTVGGSPIIHAGNLRQEFHNSGASRPEKFVKEEKDANGVYTKVTTYDPVTGSQTSVSILSGGTSPKYTTRTITYANGTVETRTLTYDDNGELISEM